MKNDGNEGIVISEDRQLSGVVQKTLRTKKHKKSLRETGIIDKNKFSIFGEVLADKKKKHGTLTEDDDESVDLLQWQLSLNRMKQLKINSGKDGKTQEANVNIKNDDSLTQGNDPNNVNDLLNETVSSEKEDDLLPVMVNDQPEDSRDYSVSASPTPESENSANKNENRRTSLSLSTNEKKGGGVGKLQIKPFDQKLVKKEKKIPGVLDIKKLTKFVDEENIKIPRRLSLMKSAAPEQNPIFPKFRGEGNIIPNDDGCKPILRKTAVKLEDLDDKEDEEGALEVMSGGDSFASNSEEIDGKKKSNNDNDFNEKKNQLIVTADTEMFGTQKQATITDVVKLSERNSSMENFSTTIVTADAEKFDIQTQATKIYSPPDSFTNDIVDTKKPCNQNRSLILSPISEPGTSLLKECQSLEERSSKNFKEHHLPYATMEVTKEENRRRWRHYSWHEDSQESVTSEGSITLTEGVTSTDGATSNDTSKVGVSFTETISLTEEQTSTEKATLTERVTSVEGGITTEGVTSTEEVLSTEKVTSIKDAASVEEGFTPDTLLKDIANNSCTVFSNGDFGDFDMPVNDRAGRCVSDINLRKVSRDDASREKGWSLLAAGEQVMSDSKFCSNKNLIYRVNLNEISTLNIERDESWVMIARGKETDCVNQREGWVSTAQGSDVKTKKENLNKFKNWVQNDTNVTADDNDMIETNYRKDRRSVEYFNDEHNRLLWDRHNLPISKRDVFDFRHDFDAYDCLQLEFIALNERSYRSPIKKMSECQKAFRHVAYSIDNVSDVLKRRQMIFETILWSG